MSSGVDGMAVPVVNLHVVRFLFGVIALISAGLVAGGVCGALVGDTPVVWRGGLWTSEYV